MGLIGGVVMALLFNAFMWLISPYMLIGMYGLKELKRGDMPWLYDTVEFLASKSELKTPKLYLAPINVPNAFAFGSPIFGYGVAVTEGLLRSLSKDEVEAVVGHEIGHIKHRDMHVMMVATALPSIFMQIGRWVMISSTYSYSGRDRESNTGAAFLIGSILMVIGWVLYLLALRLSRLREFYADAHSAITVERGAEKLQRALVRIVESNDPRRGEQLVAAKALMIADPTASYKVREYMEREASLLERVMNLFSTHPRVEDRLRKLEELKSLYG
ncbi:MAG: M48 family metalloprotease [Candidatus Korarchaeum sp.]|nr:M48 family metalloprotease [Candidatus Korarchaeum sp.]